MRRTLTIALLLFLAGTAGPAEAGPLARVDAKIEESSERAAALRRVLGWPPGRVGASLAGMLRLQGAGGAAAFHHTLYKNAMGELSSQRRRGAPEWDAALKLSGPVWKLWQAENGLRWIFFRDTALGVIVIGIGIVTVAWPLLSWWKRGVGKENDSDEVRSLQLPVIPGRPIAFHVTSADSKGTQLYEQAVEIGFLSPLVERILGCFAASPDHPASVSDHLNIPGGLIEHTARTVKAMARMAEGRIDDERWLCYLMALCHDLGKLFAYEKIAGSWIDRRLPHDRISSLIVAGMPELYTELHPPQRTALILAIRYYHNPEETPTIAPPLSYTLLELMHKADADAHEEEKGLARRQVEGVKPFLWEAFLSALPRINVNRCRGGYPEGFTAGEIVFVLEHALRERTLDQLPKEMQERLPIRRPTGRLHPAWPVLVEVLREKGILVEEVEGRRVNPSALFNITATGTTYKCVVPLRIGSLADLAPEAVKPWRDSLPYEVRIAGGRDGR
ncbi:MAG: HD domain-containing protein [Nitrospiria bacterium]